MLTLKYKNNIGSFETYEEKSITNTQLLGMLIFGEARGESALFKFNVAITVLARLTRASIFPEKFKYFGTDIKSIILKPLQYSCFNQNDPNLLKLQDPFKYAPDANVESCFLMARNVMDIFHPIKNSRDILMLMPTHYETMERNPAWASKLTYLFKIGSGEFYREDK